ncbi:hypothetical protein ACHQM5_012300 [Ranunculus cassubicifolius]
MDGAVNTRRYKSNSNTTRSPLSMHKDSHTISKIIPKIRIIHIFAPEIIKTDVENFRELVQRLTGKPSSEEKSSKKKAKNTMMMKKKPQQESKNVTMEAQFDHFQTSWGSSIENGIKLEQEEIMWGTENSSNFYNGFGDLDGFIQGLSECPLLPYNSSSQTLHQMDVFGERC